MVKKLPRFVTVELEEEEGGAAGGGRRNISMFAGDVCMAGDFVADIVVTPTARPNFPKLVRSFL